MKKILVILCIGILLMGIFPSISAARLPTVGGDSDAWGTVLNEYLNVSLNDTGHLRTSYYLDTNPFSFYNSTTIPLSTFINWSNAVNGTLLTAALFNTNYSNFYPDILNKLSWATATNGTLRLTSNLTFNGGNSSFDTNVLFINANDNRVGIGTSSPINLLDIYNGGVAITSGLLFGAAAPAYGLLTEGSIFIGGAGGLGELDIYEATPSDEATIRLSNADTGSGATDGFSFSMYAGNSFRQILYENLPMVFYTNNIPRLEISGGGLVNVTSNLTVGGNITASYFFGNGSQLIGVSAEETLWNANYSTFLTHITWADAVNGTLMSQTTYNTNYSDFYPTILSKGNGNVVGIGSFGYIPMWNGTSSQNTSNIFQLGSNVGIGTTSPSAKLQIDAGGNADTYAITRYNNSANVYWDVGVFATSSSAGGKFYIGNAGNNYFIIQNSTGNVGIGTISPIDRLSIDSSTDPVNISIGFTNNKNALFKFEANGQFVMDADNDDTSRIIGFYNHAPNTKPVLLLTDTGYVGVGIESPSETLDVNGSMRIRFSQSNIYSKYGVISFTIPANTLAETAMFNIAIPSTSVYSVEAHVGCYGNSGSGDANWAGMISGYGGSTGLFTEIVDVSTGSEVTMSMGLPSAGIARISAKNTDGAEVKLCYGSYVLTSY